MPDDFVRTEKFLYHDVVVEPDNYDGDSFDFTVRRAGYDFGFGIKIRAAADFGPFRVRLYRVDTFEIRDPDVDKRDKAKKARRVVRDTFMLYAGRISVETFKSKRADKKGKYGRYIGRVWLRASEEHTLEGALCLSEELEKAGLTTGKIYEV